jgi:transcriptional regulator with XRE-family HTH domain
MPRVDEQIRRARRESGFSQEALAERIGVAPADLDRYEEGAQISTRHLELIAVATGKPVSFFLDGTGSGEADRPKGIGGRIRSAIAWLSEPAGLDDGSDQLAALTERERVIAHRERLLAKRERELESSMHEEGEQVTAQGARGQELEERERALATREEQLATKEELLSNRARTVEARVAELDRLQKNLEARAAALEAAPAPAASPEPEVEPAVAARGFNLDALEHTLDERAGDFPDRVDEWRAYLVFLRDFVHADGELPPAFNALVREVFHDLLA